MGQQHRKTVKRRRRAGYLARNKATAKAAAPIRKEGPRQKTKRAAAPAAAE